MDSGRASRPTRFTHSADGIHARSGGHRIVATAPGCLREECRSGDRFSRFSILAPDSSFDSIESSIMKIDRRSFLAASSASLVLAKSARSSAAPFQPLEAPGPVAIEGKHVAVYTTAANSNSRLSATDTLTFK